MNSVSNESGRLSVISYQLSVVSYRLSVISCLPCEIRPKENISSGSVISLRVESKESGLKRISENPFSL